MTGQYQTKLKISSFRAIPSTLHSQSCYVITLELKERQQKIKHILNGIYEIALQKFPRKEKRTPCFLNKFISDLIVFNLPLGCKTENCTQSFRPLLMRSDVTAKTNSGHNRQFHFHLVRESSRGGWRAPPRRRFHAVYTSAERKVCKKARQPY